MLCLLTDYLHASTTLSRILLFSIEVVLTAENYLVNPWLEVERKGISVEKRHDEGLQYMEPIYLSFA